MYRWAEGYTVEQLRLRYKKHKGRFDTEIRRIVRDHPEYLTSHVRRMAPPEEDIFGSQQRSEYVPRASTALTTPVHPTQALKGKQREPGRSEGEKGRAPSPIAVRCVLVAFHRSSMQTFNMCRGRSISAPYVSIKGCRTPRRLTLKFKWIKSWELSRLRYQPVVSPLIQRQTRFPIPNYTRGMQSCQICHKNETPLLCDLDLATLEGSSPFFASLSQRFDRFS